MPRDNGKRELCQRVESADHIWRLIFPDANGKWYKIYVVNYHETYYITHIDGNSCPIELNPEGKIKESETFGSSSFDAGRGEPERVWNGIIVSARTWMGLAAKDWIRANIAFHGKTRKILLSKMVFKYYFM
jgi:hypothetical protein